MRKRALYSVAIVLAVILILPSLVLTLAYGEPEPCRALAVERARHTAAGNTGLEATLEPWQRLATSQMSALQCAGGMLDSWGERLSHRLPK